MQLHIPVPVWLCILTPDIGIYQILYSKFTAVCVLLRIKSENHSTLLIKYQLTLGKKKKSYYDFVMAFICTRRRNQVSTQGLNTHWPICVYNL